MRNLGAEVVHEEARAEGHEVSPVPAIPYTEIACSHCNGAGHTQRVWGLGMREIRERSGIGLTEMAHRLGISHAFLSDMELGKRKMSEQWAERILEECRAVQYRKDA